MRRIFARHSFGSFNLVFCVAALLLGATARAQTNPTPFLYPLSPAATQPGGPAFSLTVNGTGFVSGAVVNWNGSPRPTTFVSNSQLSATITDADIATPKTAVITVTNPSPGGGISNQQNFQVTFRYDALSFQDSAVSTLSNVAKVLTGDFNGDGKPDVVALERLPDSTTIIQILLGNGDGTFQLPVTVSPIIPAGIIVTDLAVGDLNGDGKLDLVGSYDDFRTGPGSGTFAFLGNGDGTFQPPVEHGNDVSFSGSSTVIADVNGDGIPDLVQSCSVGVCVELGEGDGTFQPYFTYSTAKFEPLASQSVVVGDFHKTGKLDIVAAFDYTNVDGQTSYYLVMLPGNGDGTFGAASVIYEGQTSTSLPSGGFESMIVADFYGDGNLDLGFYFYNLGVPPTATLSSMRGNGDGTFQNPLSVNGLPESYIPSTLLPGDFNGDGHIDVAANNSVVLLGNGGGPDSYSVIATPSSAPAYAVADFNGDGRLDWIGIDSNFNVHVVLQTSVPDFAGSINEPSYQDVVPGGTATYTIAVTSNNGFVGTIEFSASGLPPGAAATFTPSTLVGSGTVTVTITTSKHTPKGSFPILVSGTSVGITHSGGITLNVGSNDEKFEDFGGTITPGNQTVVPGGSTTFQINVFPLNGFDSDVRLRVLGLPPGATATFNPPVIAGGSGSSVLTVTTANPTPTGTYQLIVIGTGGGRRHSNGMNLNVGPAGTNFTD